MTIEVSLLPVCNGMIGVIVINKPFIIKIGIFFKRSYRLFSFVHALIYASKRLHVRVSLFKYLSKSINFSRKVFFCNFKYKISPKHFF